MINVNDDNLMFCLNTNHTSYAFCVSEFGVPEHLHYGGLIMDGVASCDAKSSLQEKYSHGRGTSVNYNRDSHLVLEDLGLEVSSLGKGDFREPFVVLTYADGSTTSDFIYKSHELLSNHPIDKIPGLPSSYEDEDSPAEVLKITLTERVKKVELDLIYTVFPESDVITRRAVLRNTGDEPVVINRLMSMQLDLDETGYQMITFGGNWAREMMMHKTSLEHGLFVNRSISGVSSNRNNPFVMLAGAESGETFGEVYGFNLIYSGNHYEACETGAFYRTRFVSGIEPDGFSWQLSPDEAFYTPEAVMTYSDRGYRGVSANMHYFIRHNIVRGEYKNKPRPILLNSWEAAYFNINEHKLKSLARKAADAGMELFVMDDGWFKGRDNDKTSLGDWVADTKKLPHGIRHLSDGIHEMGLLFGIWVEPEMVNEDSDLYRAHPEWAMKAPSRDHSLGRNQCLLDLTNPFVVQYVIDAMTNVFEGNGIDYVKWDMNRMVSDLFSGVLTPERQGETHHRWMLGLYEILDTLMGRFPRILFEGCASGGNRFDLGMLCYFPQIWASDDTDAMMRTKIQQGYSYGYPMSVVSAHVSDCPNHQTLRNTPMDTRFNVAAFGLLGYEINLCEIKSEEYEQIKEQVAIYKQWREVFFSGDFFRMGHEWMVVSKDRKKAVAMIWNELTNPNDFHLRLKTVGLDEKLMYHFYNQKKRYDLKQFGDLINHVAPIHVKKDSLLHNTISKFVKMDGELEDYVVSGMQLNNAGVRLSQAFGGTGYEGNTRLYQDFASRMYFCEAVDE